MGQAERPRMIPAARAPGLALNRAPAPPAPVLRDHAAGYRRARTGRLPTGPRPPCGPRPGLPVLMAAGPERFGSALPAGGPLGSRRIPVGARYDADSMPTGFPPPRSQRRRGRSGRPVPIGPLLGDVLPARLQSRLLSVGRIREVWETAVPAPLAGRLYPESFERGILTVRAGDDGVVKEARRRRRQLRSGLRRALHLPAARVRLRIRRPAPSAAPLAGRVAR